MTYDEWQKILVVNLTGPMLCIKAAVPTMKHKAQGES